MKQLTAILFIFAALLSSPGQEKHWAYQPLSKPAVPTATGPSARTPIDHFILQKLSAAGLQLPPEADRRTLIRRVYFNLIGLPPSPEQVRAFLEDTSAEAYDRLVKQLLDSPRYGERWARHWMDAAHFAETHGHDQDRIRTNAWPYRDYLIAAFNTDKPYSRFVQEQVAGDVLYPEDPQATVALGFLASGPWDESSLRDIREDTLDRQIGRYLDRDDMVATVMQTFNSATVQCARCHDHKFDPIPTADYYGLQAVFAAVDRADRPYDSDPQVHARRQNLLRDRKLAETLNPDFLLGKGVEERVARWEKTNQEQKLTWEFVQPISFISAGGAILKREQDGSIISTGPRPDRDTYSISVQVEQGRTITGLRLELLADDRLPKRGPGRQDNGNLHLTEFQAVLFLEGATEGLPLSIGSASADFNQEGWTIQHALDGNDKTAWGIFPRVGESHQAIFALKEPLKLPVQSTLVLQLKQLHGDGHLVGKFRFALTSSELPSTPLFLPEDIRTILAQAPAERDESERLALHRFVITNEIAQELKALPAPSKVYAAAADFEPDGGLKPAGKPRPVHLLRRGEITKPGALAAPGALTCIENLSGDFTLDPKSGDSERRAALARWLSHPENVLTWRSIVNRVWHYHFGRGLVDTPNDFGRMGSSPSHPELLDWLAAWFRDEAKGSFKALHHLIVTSAIYRQSSARNIQAADRDPENRLLWRMNRTRLDAEQMRDAVLQVAGSLDLRMGGPSDMQFDLQPGHHVTPRVDYAKFDVSSAGAKRRSVYRFLFRTLPDPLMDALDCPAGDQLTPVRNSSVTVQQALALWNNAFVAHYADAAAKRFSAQHTDLPAQVTALYQAALAREPSAGELEELIAYGRKHGLSNVARVVFNLNEFVFVN